jgi:hypothetical protein
VNTQVLRIGDAERDAAIAALSRHYADGRLTKVEHEERIGLAMNARTDADLGTLFADLPRFDDAAALRRADSGSYSHRILRFTLRAAIGIVGVAVLLHLIPFIVMAILAFFVMRVAFGYRRRWPGATDQEWTRAQQIGWQPGRGYGRR